MKFKSFPVVDSVLKDANERFAPSFEPDAERVDTLRQYCSVIDGMIEEFRGDEFECEVDEIDMTVRLELVLESFTSEEPNHAVNQLISRAMSFRVDYVDDGHIRLNFVFPSLWRKA